MAVVVRSLRDLRTLLPSKTSARREDRFTRALPRDESVTGPLIPCSSCGERMWFAEAVARQLGDQWAGFAHADCKVDTSRQAKLAERQSSFLQHAGRLRARAA